MTAAVTISKVRTISRKGRSIVIGILRDYTPGSSIIEEMR